MPFSKRTQWNTSLNPLTNEVEHCRRTETPFLDLTVSNPTQCGFEFYRDDLLKAFQDSKNLTYTPNPRGLLDARKALCEDYAARGVALKPDQIFLTASTSEAYSFLFHLLFETGETLMIPQPGYPLLHYLAELHQLKLETYALHYSTRWQLSLQKIQSRTAVHPRGILTVNPNNPTGNYIHMEEFAELCLASKFYDIPLISDEVFFDFAMPEADSSRLSLASNKETLTFTLGGISKMLGLPQMKLSWIIVTGPEKLKTDALSRLEIIADTYLSANTPTQNALPVWLQHRGAIQKEILSRLEANWKFLKSECEKSPIRILKCEGGWNAVLQMPSHKTDEDWAVELMRTSRVLTHPGYLFDFKEGSFLVVSLLIPEKNFQEGLRQILKQVQIPV